MGIDVGQPLLSTGWDRTGINLLTLPLEAAAAVVNQSVKLGNKARFS